MSILAIVSKSEFEKAVASPVVGGLWPVTTYFSSNPVLEPLGQGGDLYLVTVRPNDKLWLAAVLRSPKKGAKGWTAKANTAAIRDATSVIYAATSITASASRQPAPRLSHDST